MSPGLVFSMTEKNWKDVLLWVLLEADSDNIKNIYYKVVTMKKAKTIWNATSVSINFKHGIIVSVLFSMQLFSAEDFVFLFLIESL